MTGSLELEQMRLLRRHCSRWEDNDKVDLKELGYDMLWTGFAHHRIQSNGLDQPMKCVQTISGVQTSSFPGGKVAGA
jgi:hypothetical protein